MATVTARKPRRRIAVKPEPVPAAETDYAPAESDEYWTSTRRPFVCLVFLAPLLIAYEIGVLWLGDGRDELLRNGADTWMRSWLYAAGVQNSFALPLVVMALLLLWNFYGYLRWHVRPETLGGMLAESLIFAFVLVVAGQASELVCRRAGLPTAAIGSNASMPSLANAGPVRLSECLSNAPLSLGREAGGEGRRLAFLEETSLRDAAPDCCKAQVNALSLPSPPTPLPRKRGGDHTGGTTSNLVLSLMVDAAADQPSSSQEGTNVAEAATEARRTVARAVTFVGAGVYEEVLFRLLLLPACYGWFRLLQAGPKASAVLAVVATSLMFALAHYVGPAGDTLVPYTFCFRAAAGAYFAALFITRGFGITVGTHAAYDLIVGVVWVA